MEERERIINKIRELIDDEEERERCIELLDAAVSGLERGLSPGVERKIREMLEALADELEAIAGQIEGRIKD